MSKGGVLSEFCDSALVLPDDPQRCDGGGCVEGRERSGEDVSRAREPLMRDDRPVGHSKPSDGSEGVGHGPASDGHVRSWDPPVLQRSLPGFSQRSQRHRLVQQDTKLVLLCQLDDFLERADHPCVLVEPFDHDEPAIERLLVLGVRLFDDLQDAFQVSHVVMTKLLHVRPRQVDSGLQRVGDCLVSDHQVPALEEGRDDGRGCGSIVRVDNPSLCPVELGQLPLQFQVYVDRPVEAARPAGTNAVLPDRLLALVLDGGLVEHVEEVEGSEVDRLLAVDDDAAALVGADNPLRPLHDAR
mmetsp:Transcript_33480/g.75120  ORF Transcript_33480/g.75120 Transcript_33480/m.75120 type:complete len:299 (-) Transcript_33480:353-1249(-)